MSRPEKRRLLWIALIVVILIGGYMAWRKHIFGNDDSPIVVADATTGQKDKDPAGKPIPLPFIKIRNADLKSANSAHHIKHPKYHGTTLEVIDENGNSNSEPISSSNWRVTFTSGSATVLAFQGQADSQDTETEDVAIDPGSYLFSDNGRGTAYEYPIRFDTVSLYYGDATTPAKQFPGTLACIHYCTSKECNGPAKCEYPK